METLARAASIHRRIGARNREALALDTTGQAYQALDRPEEAKEFHSQAAATHHELRDDWNQALALTHLAGALDALGEHDPASQARTEALGLVAAYDDPRAGQLRQHLTEAVRNPGA